MKASRLPRYAIFRGRRMEVLNYEGNSYVTLLDSKDKRFYTHIDNVTFVKGGKK